MTVITRGEGPAPDHLAFAPRARRVIELAVEEAKALGHLYVGTEHLPLGLTRTDDPDVARAVAIGILRAMGVDPEQVRTNVVQVLAGTARTRDNVVTCRVDDRTLATLDTLVEAGVYVTRSEAAARLILAGIEASQPLLEKV